ncbi:hypothetical protein KIL84_019970 [Mauremys mutica]|uniref:Uncharacterized protein n=1 Tax=Mauremys mutica TaxID=74926 RepID=A0A9D3XXF7_9SAUR|nr:hypothetical protein KIL84_019970 [Mauremys mutica]
MSHAADQFKEAPAGTKKNELADIIKHDQMRLQVAKAFLNENLKSVDENDIPPIQQNTLVKTFSYNQDLF